LSVLLRGHAPRNSCAYLAGSVSAAVVRTVVGLAAGAAASVVGPDMTATLSGRARLRWR
jgi:hypothetical protein